MIWGEGRREFSGAGLFGGWLLVFCSIFVVLKSCLS